jgi:hypothetical protein
MMINIISSVIITITMSDIATISIALNTSNNNISLSHVRSHAKYRSTIHYCCNCQYPFTITDINKLITLSHPCILPIKNDMWVRKYSEDHKHIIYFCCKRCYNAYEKSKNNCFIC